MIIVLMKIFNKANHYNFKNHSLKLFKHFYDFWTWWLINFKRAYENLNVIKIFLYEFEIKLIFK